MSYEQCLVDAMRMYRVDTPTDKCKHLARAVHRMKNKYAQYENARSSRTSLVIEHIPEVRVEKKNICQAVTLTGKPCGFKSVCGNFCKKHQPRN